MRGDERRQEGFVFFTSLEDRIPCAHPLRPIRRMVDRALAEMSPLLDRRYAQGGRHSIPPEYLTRAQFLQTLFAIPPERRLCELSALKKVQASSLALTTALAASGA